jgi:hypothetical protein
MQVASFVAAVFGAVLASLSLGWQAANFVLTGGRIKVQLQVGAMDIHGAAMTGSADTVKPNGFAEPAAHGHNQPILAVQVANVGRQPVTVARWRLEHIRGVSLTRS